MRFRSYWCHYVHDGTGTGWDETAPADADQVPLGAQEIRDLRKGVRIRTELEHDTPAAASAGGWHRSGSAKAYFGGGAPTQRPDAATALSASDNGRLWLDGGVLKYYSHPNWVAISGTATGIAAAVLRHKVSQGTGGGAFNDGSWRTRSLNEELDPSGIVTLAANQFTLAAGTYLIRAACPACKVNIHQARLRNITDGTTTLVGSSELSGDSATSASVPSRVEGTFTIAGAKTFELQHRCEHSNSSINGMGQAESFPWGESDEVHTTCQIVKLS